MSDRLFRIYYFKDGRYFFDRNMAIEHFAEKRVKELKSRGHEHAVFLIDHLIKGAFY